jgi:RNA polymerase sigma factor (sigma-70 family)
MGGPEDAAGFTIDDQSAEVCAAMRQLPRRQGQVIALVYFDGMSVADAGRLIGCSRETAKTHLKRGRKALAARVGVEEDADA